MQRFKNNDTFTCLFLTTCYTGLRPGEACALTWDSVDLKNKIINIEHNVYSKLKDEKGRWYIGTPKTVNGDRQVYINETLLKALENYKKKQKKLNKKYSKKYHYYHLESIKNKYGKVTEYRIVETHRKSRKIEQLDLIFTKENGKYVATDIIKYPYKIVHTELEMQNCRFYDLRGSFATGSLRNGAEIKDIADLLGHSKIETTENYYISSTDETRRKTCENFEKVIQSNVINKIVEYNSSIN